MCLPLPAVSHVRALTEMFLPHLRPAQQRQVVLASSVLYRGSAIPVAWVVMTERGLWSPRLWRRITQNGWHPLTRIRPDVTFAPASVANARGRGPG